MVKKYDEEKKWNNLRTCQKINKISQKQER